MTSKSMSAKFGHIKRGLSKGEPLKGKTLELALDILGNEFDDSEHDIFMKGIRNKIVSGEKLSEYEYHFFVEVIIDQLKLFGGEHDE